VRRGVAAAFPRQFQAIITTREVWASHRYPGARAAVAAEAIAT
jgi:hypothetical protein